MEWLPSLLAANPLDFEAGLNRIEQANLNQVHLDIMDGHFVPNISFGPAVVKMVAQKHPNLFRDVHLMLSKPEDFIQKFIDVGAQRIFIHIEIAPQSLEKSLEILSQNKILWGLAINPETSIATLEKYKNLFPNIDRLLVMSVHPGFSGQSFIKGTFQRIKDLKNLYPTVSLCLDGGINKLLAEELIPFGVNNFVVGASFYEEQIPTGCSRTAFQS